MAREVAGGPQRLLSLCCTATLVKYLLDDGEEGVDTERRVADHANDAKHGRAAVVALGVELEGLDLRVVVAHPVDLHILHDVAGRVGRVLRTAIPHACKNEREMAGSVGSFGTVEWSGGGERGNGGEESSEKESAARARATETSSLGESSTPPASHSPLPPLPNAATEALPGPNSLGFPWW